MPTGDSGETISWRVFIPVTTLKVYKGNEITFGNFRLGYIKDDPNYIDSGFNLKNDDLYNYLCLSILLEGNKVPIDKICDNCPRNQNEIKRIVTNPNGSSHEVNIIKRENCSCVSFKKLDAPISAIAISREILENVCSLIRFYLSNMYAGNFPSYTVVALSCMKNYSSTVGLSSNKVVHEVQDFDGIWAYDLRLKQHHINEWNKLNFEKAAQAVMEIYLGENNNPLDQTVVSSLIWCGNMLEVEDDYKEFFLRGATSVETLTNKISSYGKIKKNFTEYGSTLFLIGLNKYLINVEDESDPLVLTRFEDLSEQYTRSKQMLSIIYKNRCHISHGARKINDVLYGNTKTDMNSDWEREYAFITINIGAIYLWQKSHTLDEFYNRLKRIKSILDYLELNKGIMNKKMISYLEQLAKNHQSSEISDTEE